MKPLQRLRILPHGDFRRAGGKQERGSDGLQSFAFDSLSVTSTWTASYCYALATNGAARYMMAHHRTGCPKHRPVLMCAMVWGTLLHSRVMDPSSVLLQ